MARDLYTAAWDYGRLNLGAMSAGVNGMVFTNGITGTAGWDSGVYMHSAVTGTCDGVTISSFRAAILAQMVGGAPTITWAPTTGLYTIASGAGAFTITWAGALGTQMRDALGFAGSATSNATSHTSTLRPDYMIISRVAGQSAVHETYKPSGRINYVESDDGTAYSTRPSTVPTYREWVQPFETNTGPTNAEWSAANTVGGAPVRRTDATTTSVSWTWEDFYELVASEMPFALLDRAVTTKGEGAIYKLRGEAANFDPTRVTADFDGHWSMTFKAIVKTATAAA